MSEPHCVSVERWYNGITYKGAQMSALSGGCNRRFSFMGWYKDHGHLLGKILVDGWRVPPSGVRLGIGSARMGHVRGDGVDRRFCFSWIGIHG